LITQAITEGRESQPDNSTTEQHTLDPSEAEPDHSFPRLSEAERKAGLWNASKYWTTRYGKPCRRM
jgi:hypothetical protein